MTDEDDEFVRIEKESLWRKRQIEENLGQPVYFKPKKEWVGLTDEDEIDWDGGDLRSFVKAVEAKLKEKNHV
jgi:hypothetical protein